MDPLNQQACVVLTTCGSWESAQAIAREVVEERLAACVQMLEIRSVYTWKGELAEEPEILLLMKTRHDRYLELESAIRARHTYEVPEILQLPVERGFGPYLAWLDEALSTEPGEH